MLDIDVLEFRTIFVTRDAIDRHRYLIANFKIVPRRGVTVKDVAARLALLASVGTVRKLKHETAERRGTLSAKVVRAEENGDVTIAFPIELFGARESLTQVLTVLFYGAAYNYADHFWLESVEFPKAMLARFSGPRFGVAGIRKMFGVPKRPLTGVILKPRLGAALADFVRLAGECLSAGADFVVDDELVLDPDGELAFERRVDALSRVASGHRGEKKAYFANVATSPVRATAYARRAVELGAAGILVNAFTMGFATVQELVDELKGLAPVVVHNMGVGILTRPAQADVRVKPTGASDAFIAKLSRLVGGDAIHAGISNADWYHNEAWGEPVIELQSALGDARPAFCVAAGSLSVANIAGNIRSLGPDVMLEAGGGILGYPGGAAKGAAAFRLLAEEMRHNMSASDAHERILDLAEKHRDLRQGLDFFGYTKSGAA